MKMTYMPDADFRRLVNFLANEFMHGALADHRDELVMGLVETVGIAPEYSRPDDEIRHFVAF